MAKRIIMIPPFDVLTGNLSGKQDLKYAENDNPAFEAPDGSQSARNYTVRYVGARRANGKTYFSIKSKSTTVLNSVTRMQMALTGAIAAIRSAVMALPVAGSGRTPWQTIEAAYAYYKNENPSERDAKSLQAFFDARVRQMLTLRRTTIEFNAHPGGYTLHNPFDLASSSALVISQSIWVKFADILANINPQTDKMYVIYISGKKLVLSGSKTVNPSFGGFVPSITNIANPMYKAAVTGLTIGSSDEVLYQTYPIALGGEPVDADDEIVDGAKYTVV